MHSLAEGRVGLDAIQTPLFGWRLYSFLFVCSALDLIIIASSHLLITLLSVLRKLILIHNELILFTIIKTMSSAADNANHDENPVMVRDDGRCEEEDLESSPSASTHQQQQQQQQPDWTPLEKKIVALKVVPVISFLLMTIIAGAATLRPEYDQFAWMMYQVSLLFVGVEIQVQREFLEWESEIPSDIGR